MTVFILTNQTELHYETTRLIESFTNNNINFKIINPDKIDIVINKNIKDSIYYNNELISMPALVLVRFGSGIKPFHLSVIRQFEQAGVPCINSSNSIEIVKDKFQTSQILSRAGIAVPNAMLVKSAIDVELVDKQIGFPCVIKVITGSFGNGVYLCNYKHDFKKLMEFINKLGVKKQLIVQEFLNDKVGEDLRVWVIGNKVIGAMKRTAIDGDFRANITRGGIGESFEVTPDIEHLVLSTARALDLDIAGIDLLFDHQGFRVCEANANPGFSGFEQYCNTNIAEQIAKYVKLKINLVDKQ